MPQIVSPKDKNLPAPSFAEVCQPFQEIIGCAPPLESRSNRPLALTFEDQLRMLIFYHLEEHTSGCHLLQVLEEDDFARETVAPSGGIRKSTFFETLNTRGLEQFLHVYASLRPYVPALLPPRHGDLGDLVAIDGSLIDAVLSMSWADYRKGSKKARIHLGFDISRSVPSAFFLTDGKSGERPFVSLILSPGQTGVMDRGYQCHRMFDLLQAEGKSFVCRIRANTKKTVITENPVSPGSNVFYDAAVLLGTPGVSQTEKEVRVVGYRIDNATYWVATDRSDLSAEEIAAIYKLRWDIEKFFAWWKRHLKVCHLIARSKHGLMIQILAGLITYLLLALYFQIRHNEKVSIKRVRQLRAEIRNECRIPEKKPPMTNEIKIVIALNFKPNVKL
jgi:hypothetical protein